ncbi:hypothetical protein [Furfurilactobacillus curtus]|uniref:Uncharacterized protein n=1 Tax=Furfurilactobacillus curtus TaxID=1746200 RepID=A0ABQ5JPS5_9LACO
MRRKANEIFYYWWRGRAGQILAKQLVNEVHTVIVGVHEHKPLADVVATLAGLLKADNTVREVITMHAGGKPIQ